MISWVPKKNIDLEKINTNILDCIESKHFTNNGKYVQLMQFKIKQLFKIEEDNEVLMTCNGAMGLNCLIGAFNIQYNRELRWIVQSFTFPCSTQGNLVNSIVIDIDENMGPNIKELTEKINDYDGIVVTNCFGTCTNIELYEDFCKRNNKLLIFDNAASPLTYYNNKNHLNYGDGCMVSLHHTKPIGFGEGGFIVFKKKYLEFMKKALCFGYTDQNKYEYNIYSHNYKMSEIACIYISNYINNINSINNHHIQMMDYFISEIKNNNLENKIKLFPNYVKYNQCLMSTIPIIFNNAVSVDIFVNHNVEAKKYYYPINIKDNPNSKQLFDTIVCLPLNIDTTFDTIRFYINILLRI
jgi:dTDP-4-amino-4,6-dideoxygalactose transaminase